MKNEYCEYMMKWARFGAGMSQTHEKGIVSSQLREKDIIVSKDGPVIISYGGMVQIDYPNDYMKIVEAIKYMSEWMGADEFAAFRFGYMQCAGEMGELIFNTLRSEYNVYSHPRFQYNRDLPSGCDDTADLILAKSKEWIDIRQYMHHGDLDGEYHLSGWNKWCEQRANILEIPVTMSDEMFGRGLSTSADEHHMLKALLTANLENSLINVISSLMALSKFKYQRSQCSAGYGYKWLINRLYETHKEHISDPDIGEYIRRMNVAYPEEKYTRIQPHLRAVGDINNVLHLLWVFDDIQVCDLK